MATPYRTAVLATPTVSQPHRPPWWRVTALLVCTAGSATQMRATPAPRDAPPEGRAVASIASGRNRLLLVARDGTTWSVPGGGVTVGDEVRQLPQRERPENAVALAESSLGLWVLGRDGRVRVQPTARGRDDLSVKEVFRDLPPVVAMAAMNHETAVDPCSCSPDDTCEGAIETDATVLALLDRDGALHLRSASREVAWQRDRVPIPARVREVAVGSTWGCAVDERGGAWCFMPDWRHGLAIGVESDFHVPPSGDGPVAERIAVPAPVAHLAVSGDFACAETVAGRVWCWRHTFQQANLCDAHLPLTTDLREDTTPGVNATRASALDFVAHQTMPELGPSWFRRAVPALAQDDVWRVRDPAHTLSYFSSRTTAACALSPDGALRCMGAWRADGHRVASVSPVTVSLPRRAVSLVDDADSTRCVLDDVGGVWCWGLPLDPSGDLPAGPPRRVPGLGVVRQIGVSHARFCALTRDGSVWCWARNGHDERPIELRPRGYADALRLDHRRITGLLHRGANTPFDACDPARDDTCLADNTPVREADHPLAPGAVDYNPDFDGVIRTLGAIRGWARWWGSICAIRPEGRVVCWKSFPREALRLVPSIEDARSLSVLRGGNDTYAASGCALLGDGRVQCWGDDRGGLLGDGRHTHDAWGVVRLPAR